MYSENNSSNTLSEILSYSLPKLHTGKEWYVGFNAFDPLSGKMKRKKIKLNHIEKVAERRKYAAGLITRLLGKLESGWNPWIEVETSKSYESFDVAINVYRQYLDKLLKDDNLRMPTKRCYDSRTNMLIKFNNQRRVPIKYIYQFDRFFVSEFMNWVYIDLDNTI